MIQFNFCPQSGQNFILFDTTLSQYPQHLCRFRYCVYTVSFGSSLLHSGQNFFVLSVIVPQCSQIFSSCIRSVPKPYIRRLSIRTAFDLLVILPHLRTSAAHRIHYRRYFYQALCIRIADSRSADLPKGYSPHRNVYLHCTSHRRSIYRRYDRC